MLTDFYILLQAQGLFPALCRELYVLHRPSLSDTACNIWISCRVRECLWYFKAYFIHQYSRTYRFSIDWVLTDGAYWFPLLDTFWLFRLQLFPILRYAIVPPDVEFDAVRHQDFLTSKNLMIELLAELFLFVQIRQGILFCVVLSIEEESYWFARSLLLSVRCLSKDRRPASACSNLFTKSFI